MTIRLGRIGGTSFEHLSTWLGAYGEIGPSVSMLISHWLWSLLWDFIHYPFLLAKYLNPQHIPDVNKHKSLT